MDPLVPRHPAVVQPPQFLGRAIGLFLHHLLQDVPRDRRPPPLSNGADEPVSRSRITQRNSELTLIANCLATPTYVPPASYARTAHSRSSTGYGFGIAPI